MPPENINLITGTYVGVIRESPVIQFIVFFLCWLSFTGTWWE
jgi:hypothetical protein